MSADKSWVIRLHGPMGQVCGYVSAVGRDGGFVRVPDVRKARRFDRTAADKALERIKPAIPSTLAPCIAEAQ
jgi:hypothetical protein